MNDMGGTAKSSSFEMLHQRYGGLNLYCVAPTRGECRQYIVLLHGYGDTANACAAKLPLRALVGSGAFVVVPDGVLAATLLPGRAWYSLSSNAARNMHGASVAARELMNALDELEQARGRAPVWLAGFSQGGAVGLAAGLARPERIERVYSVAAAIDMSAQIATVASRVTREFLLFGIDGDPFVPLQEIDACHAAIARLGHRASLVRLPGQAHAVSMFAWRKLCRAVCTTPYGDRAREQRD